MDYSANIRAIIASYYVGTGGLDIGLVNACQGIAGGKNWEQTFSSHQKIVCDAILKVVDACFADNLKEEIELTKKKLTMKKYRFLMAWDGSVKAQDTLTIVTVVMCISLV